jgi:hypothetical protein
MGNRFGILLFGSATLAVCSGVAACSGAAYGIDGAGLSLGDSSDVDDRPAPNFSCDFKQAYGNATHSGIACPQQHGLRIVEQLSQDVDATAELAGDDNFLRIHEGAPLTSGDFVVIPTHRGFTDYLDRSRDVWGVQVYRWVPSVLDPAAHLAPQWSADTDWKPVDGLTPDTALVWTSGYIAPLGAVIHGSTLTVEGAHGTIHRYDLSTGTQLETVNPLVGTPFDGDALTATTSLLSASDAGTIYYTVTALNPQLSISINARAAYLVEVTPDDRSRIVEWQQIATLAVGIPGDSRTDESGMCDWSMRFSPTKHPTGPDSTPPRFHCGLQRPAFNTPVSIDPTTGHLIVFSIANGSRRYAYLIDVDPNTLTPLFASSTMGHMLYACGDRFSLDNPANEDCRVITANGTVNLGRDAEFNQPVAYQGQDIDLNAIVVAPNGDRSIGGYDGGFRFDFDGFAAQGSTISFDNTGAFKAYNPDFGWSASPVVWQHPRISGPPTYSYLIDRNIWAGATTTADFQTGLGSYSLDWTLERASNVPEVFPKPSGGNQARAFINAAISFGPSGDRYALNEDGHLYAFDADGLTTEMLPLPGPDGQPIAIETIGNFHARDRLGRIYVSYGGFVWVIAGGGAKNAPGPAARPIASHTSARAASLRHLAQPDPRE